MVENRDLDREIDKRVKIIDSKLQSAFSLIKKDIKDIKKQSGKTDTSNIEAKIESLKKELSYKNKPIIQKDYKEIAKLQLEISTIKKDQQFKERINSEKAHHTKLKHKLALKKQEAKLLGNQNKTYASIATQTSKNFINTLKEIQKQQQNSLEETKKEQEKLKQLYEMKIAEMQIQHNLDKAQTESRYSKELREISEEKDELKSEFYNLAKKFDKNKKSPSISVTKEAYRKFGLSDLPSTLSTSIFLFFILCLFLISLNQVVTLSFLNHLNTELSLAAFFSGVFLFWTNRAKLKQLLAESNSSELSSNKNQLHKSLLHKGSFLKNLIRPIYSIGLPYFVTLLLITSLGFLLRIWNLDVLYPHVDEFYNLVSAKRLLIDGHFDTYEQGDLLSYIIAFIFKLGLDSVFSARVPLVIIGTLNIILIFFLASKVSKNVGIISAYLFAVSPIAVGMSRFIRYYEIYVFFILVFILTLAYLYENRKNIFGLWVLIILPIIFYILMQRIEVLFLFYCIGASYAIINYHKEILKLNKKFLFIVGIAVACLFAYFLYRVFWLYNHLIWQPSYFLTLFNPHNSCWWRVEWFTCTPVSMILILGIFILPIFLLFNNKIIKLSLSWVALFLLFFTFVISFYFAPRYSYYFIVFYVVIFASGIYLLFTLCKIYKSRVNLKLSSLIIFVTLLLIFSPLNAIVGVNATNTDKLSISSLGNLRLNLLMDSLKKEGFTVNESLITDYPYVFAYYYNYSFLDDPYSDPLNIVSTDRYTGAIKYDYGKNLYSYNNSSFDPGTRAWANSIILNKSTGLIVIDNKKISNFWEENISFPYIFENRTIYDKGDTWAGYITFRTYRWESS